MFASNLILPAACLLLLRTAIAAPAPDLGARVEGHITTSTSSVSSTLTSTATGIATASPGAANGTGKGEATVCHNTNGPFKPFCQPKPNEVYYPGSTHYVTWDPEYYHNANTNANATLVRVVGFYATNETTIPPSGPPSGKEEQAFTSDHIAAGWGFYQWQLTDQLLRAQSASLVNITLRIVALPKDGQPAQWLTGPTITLRYRPKKEAAPKHTGTDEHALYIALPTVFGVIMLVLVVTLFCTRKARRVEIDNLVAQARKSASRRKGFTLSKKDRAKNKEQNIRLMEHGGSADSDEEARGWDEGWTGSEGGKRVDRKRV